MTAPKRKAKARTKAGQNKASTEQRRSLFIEAYLSNNENATQAALDAGFSPKSAASQGSRLLKNAKVKQELDSRRAEVIRKVGINTEEALQHLWGIATADSRELTEYRVGCCRFCHGNGHRFQRTANEFERDQEALAALNEQAVADGKPTKQFDPKGGIGYDRRKDPHPDCPECFGEGVGRPIFKDTSKLSPGAAALFAGVKETDKGLEIKSHSKVDALEKVARHLGLYEKDNHQASEKTKVFIMPGAKDAPI